MQKKSIYLNIYRYIISILSSIIILYSFYFVFNNKINVNLLYFFILVISAILAEKFILNFNIFSTRINITLADIIYMIILINFPLSYLIISIVIALSQDFFRKKKEKFEIFATNFFNTAIAYIIGFYFYHYYSKNLDFSFKSLIIITLTLILIYIVNIVLVYIIVFFKSIKENYNLNFKSILTNNINLIILNLIFIAPLTFLTLFYIKFYKFVWILLLIPLTGLYLAMKNYSILYNQLKESLFILAKILDNRDWYTAQHSWRVSELAVKLAKKVKLNNNKIEIIKNAALIHDIGKIAITDNILNKPGKLTDKEFEIIKKHTIFGDIITNKILPQHAKILKYHHERWDGKGYPEGLKGKEIPLEARIIAVADTFDAMNSTRIYRKNLPFEEIIKRLKHAKGKQLDPELVDNFIEIITQSNSHKKKK